MKAETGQIAALSALLAVTGWLGISGPGRLDREVLMLANAWRSAPADAAFASLSWLGSLFVLLPLAAVLGLSLWRRGHRGAARYLMLALLGASALAEVAKQIVQRPRPDLFAALTPVVSPYSFPSAHALQVTATAVAAWLLVRQLAPDYSRQALLVLVLVVILVDLSRIYLQVHYPSDVLAGSMIGICWVVGLGRMFTARCATDA